MSHKRKASQNLEATDTIQSKEQEQKGTESKKGKFIVIEGLDRSGKSTQLGMFMKSLTRDQATHVALPYEYPNRSRTSVTGNMINSILQGTCPAPATHQALHLLFTANRWEHVNLIRDQLNAGRHVLCGRYSTSGMAYTMSLGGDISWCIAAEFGLPIPDKIIYFDVSAETQEQRRGWGNEITENKDRQAAVRVAYNKLRDENVYTKWTTVDTNSTADQVFALWAPALKEYLFPAKEQ